MDCIGWGLNCSLNYSHSLGVSDSLYSDGKEECLKGQGNQERVCVSTFRELSHTQSLKGKSFHPPPKWRVIWEQDHSLSHCRLVPLVPGSQGTRMSLCLGVGSLAFSSIIEWNVKRHLKPEPAPKKSSARSRKTESRIFANNSLNCCSPELCFLRFCVRIRVKLIQSFNFQASNKNP